MILSISEKLEFSYSDVEASLEIDRPSCFCKRLILPIHCHIESHDDFIAESIANRKIIYIGFDNSCATELDKSKPHLRTIRSDLEVVEVAVSESQNGTEILASITVPNCWIPQ